METIQIADRVIGGGNPPFIIAEIGINHEGSLEKALQLVDAVAEAGADCAKFQCHITEAEMIPTDMKPGDISDEKLWDIIKRCELNENEEKKVQRYCAQKGVIYLCTPFSREASDRLLEMDVPGFKIGSGECNNLPLLDHVSKMGKPIILSTGMNDLASVSRSVELIRKNGCPLMLMHCTSMYPTPHENVRLGAIQEMIAAFDLPVGLSDHSMGIYTCLGAVALGACALEKHFTVSKAWPGPDISISIDPAELKELVTGARAVYQAAGGQKNILQGEQPVIDFAYASVVTIAKVKAGDTFSYDNLWVKRPGTGAFSASELDKIIGRRAGCDLPEDHQLTPSDIDERKFRG